MKIMVSPLLTDNFFGEKCPLFKIPAPPPPKKIIWQPLYCPNDTSTTLRLNAFMYLRDLHVVAENHTYVFFQKTCF